MASTKGTGSTKLPILTTLTKDNKRWIVFGIALNHVLVPSIRPMLETEILKEYNDLKLNHGIDVQTSHSFPGPKYPTRNGMKYENINSNDVKLKPPHYKSYDYSTFDYKVTSHVDFGKLFLQNHMAKFNAFNESCDASAVLNLYGRIPVFSAILQTAANVVREGRNAWAHCKFPEWNKANFKKIFDDMKQFMTEVGLSPADERKVLADLNDWEEKGIILCMNATIDPELVKVVQEHVNKLSSEVEKMAFVSKEEMNNLKVKLHNVHLELQEYKKRFEQIENNMSHLTTNQGVLQQEQSITADKIGVLQQEQSITADKIAQVTTNQEVLQRELSSTVDKVEQLETSQKSAQQSGTEGQTSSYDFSSCEADINYYAKRYDRDTRQWLLKDFDTWFFGSLESRAYVLLGDAAVGKSVMAAVIAQRAKDDGNMAAAYFCRHYDGTRRDPRYLLGTVAYQLRNCNSQYDNVVGGEPGIQSILANAKLGVHELFTKLLEEPLSKCNPCKKKLVVIDALDETEYWSREDFLDLIMNRLPLLPNWLVFFITCRPEDTVQSRLRTYNPCIKICAGNGGSADFYQRHEQDIRRFLEKKVNLSTLPYSVGEMTDKCNGMFLYAFYIAEILQNPAQLDGDMFPENINGYFCKNFKRVYEKVGGDFYKKLFGCALVAPSPLPVSFISFLLQKENSSLDEQEVIDAVSQFVAFRTTDKTFAFLHSLIPASLTDEQKASRTLVIDRNEARACFRSIIVEFLNAFLQQGREPISFAKPDLVYYILDVGFRFFCKCCVRDSGSSQTVFDCLTNYRFLQQRIQSKRIGIYSLIKDLECSVLDLTFDEAEKNILDDICLVLKRDKYVIVGCPELLYSCLSNASELVQEKFIPNKVSASSMELKDVFLFTDSLPRDLDCCAFSHDKRLFAGGKGRCIFLCDARTFKRVSDTVQVMDVNLSHLEFSPDDKFVIFGRLDRWFSVQEKRVVDKTQFSGNSKCYAWVSFIDDGNYIAVVSETINKDLLHFSCLFHIFSEWAIQEFDLEFDSFKRDTFSQQIDDTTYMYRRIMVSEHFHFLRRKRKHDQSNDVHLGCCPEQSCELFSICAKFEKTKTPVRDRIALFYAVLFEYQIWNVQTGRPVIEEMFSSQLKPFFYLWHLMKMMGVHYLSIKNFYMICDSRYTLADIALVYAAYYEEHKGNTHTLFRSLQRELFSSVEEKDVMHDIDMNTSFSPDEKYLITNTPVECYNRIFSHAKVLSKAGKWLARKFRGDITLFKKVNDSGNLLSYEESLFHDIPNVYNHAFTSDGNVFVYITDSPNQNLYALSLQTGTKFRSVSGLCSLPCASEEGQGVGYIFGDTNERITVLLRDLPGTFLLNCYLKPVVVTFNSALKIMILCSDENVTLWKLCHYDLAKACVTEMSELDYSQQIRVEKCIFSRDGKLIAMHHSCQILLFNYGGKFLCSVFKVTEECEPTVPCLIFSPDDFLLLFCIQKSTHNDDQTFYVWDVEKGVLTDPILLVFPYEMHVDCCCFSSDNSKMFFCNASSVLILEYPSKVVSCPMLDVPYVNSRASDTCSHCIVSSDSILLALCVANETFIYSLDGSDALWKVPHNHLGKVEYCVFLRKNRYLISYGIDGIVFLFDFVEKKSIAYVRLESIISMALSPDEDKVVCLESSGKVSVINLHGLKQGLRPDFKLPSDFRLHAQRNHQSQRTQIIAAPFQTEDEFIIDDDDDGDQIPLYSSESDDEDVAD